MPNNPDEKLIDSMNELEDELLVLKYQRGLNEFEKALLVKVQDAKEHLLDIKPITPAEIKRLNSMERVLEQGQALIKRIDKFLHNAT